MSFDLYRPNEKYDTTTISASAYNRKVTVELPLDCTGHELLDAFRAVMVGLTYSPQSFDDVLVNYVLDNELMEKHDSSSTDVSPFLQELTNGNTIRDLEKEIKTLLDRIVELEATNERQDRIIAALREPSEGLLEYAARTADESTNIVAWENLNENYRYQVKAHTRAAIRAAVAAAEQEVES